MFSRPYDSRSDLLPTAEWRSHQEHYPEHVETTEDKVRCDLGVNMWKSILANTAPVPADEEPQSKTLHDVRHNDDVPEERSFDNGNQTTGRCPE